MLDSLDGIPPSFFNLFSKGEIIANFSPARFVCVCAQTQENGVSSPFPNVPFQYVLRTFFRKAAPPFSLLRRFTQTVPRLQRTVLTLFCWLLWTARPLFLCWTTSGCEGERSVNVMRRYMAHDGSAVGFSDEEETYELQDGIIIAVGIANVSAALESSSSCSMWSFVRTSTRVS